jgi:hypothetical protein
MSKPTVITKFRFQNRKFMITLNTYRDDGEESLELCEEVTVKEKPLKHLLVSDGILHKTVPIALATCNGKNGEVEISMRYEGLPLEPLQRFLDAIQRHYRSSAQG